MGSLPAVRCEHGKLRRVQSCIRTAAEPNRDTSRIQVEADQRESPHQTGLKLPRNHNFYLNQAHSRVSKYRGGNYVGRQDPGQSTERRRKWTHGRTCRWNKSKAGSARRSRESIKSVGGTVTGIISNRG